MLVHDDCFNYLKQIKNKSIDLILVDFPFLYIRKNELSNFQFLTWFENRCKNDIPQTEWNKMKENINEYFL